MGSEQIDLFVDAEDRRLFSGVRSLQFFISRLPSKPMLSLTHKVENTLKRGGGPDGLEVRIHRHRQRSDRQAEVADRAGFVPLVSEKQSQ